MCENHIKELKVLLTVAMCMLYVSNSYPTQIGTAYQQCKSCLMSFASLLNKPARRRFSGLGCEEPCRECRQGVVLELAQEPELGKLATERGLHSRTEIKCRWRPPPKYYETGHAGASSLACWLHRHLCGTIHRGLISSHSFDNISSFFECS